MSSSDQSSKPYHGGYNSNAQQNYGFSPQNISAPVLGSIGGQLTGSIYTSSSGSGPSSVSLTPPPMQIAMWGFMSDGSITVSVRQQENGKLVTAELDPDGGLSALDSLRIQTLLTAISVAVASSNTHQMQPITYIRRHNLERHFRFSST